MRWPLKAALRWLLVFACLALSLACRRGAAPAPAGSAAVAEAPPPPGLVAELWVGDPRLFWEQLRPLGGAAAGLLPSRLPLLLVAALGLPPDAASSFDDQVPVLGVVLAGTTNDVVLGLHVTSGAELVASLTTGSRARFRAEVRPPRLTLLESVEAGAGRALGVSGNYLLLAERRDAIAAAGRYVAENVAKRANTSATLELRTKEGALAGPVAAAIRSAWRAKREDLAAQARAERAARGRPADFVEPAALIEGMDAVVESWLGVLASSRELTLRVSPEAGRLRVQAALSPAAEGAAERLRRELVVGEASPLFALPNRTLAAISLREGPSSVPPEASAAALSGLLGQRLSSADARRITGALAALRALRSGATTLSLSREPAPSLLVTSDVSDPAALTPALRAGLSLVELAPVSAWLTGGWGKPAFTWGAGSRGESGQARLRFVPQDKISPPTELNLAWNAELGPARVIASLGPDAARVLGELGRDPKLEQNAWLNESQRYLGVRTALSVFFDARLLGVAGGAPFVVLGFGKEDAQILALADFAPDALSALVSVALSR